MNLASAGHAVSMIVPRPICSVGRSELPAAAFAAVLGRGAGSGAPDRTARAVVTRLPGLRIDAAIEALAPRSHDETLGLTLASHAPLGSLGFLDYRASTSTTLGEALERISRFYDLLTDRSRLSIELVEEEVHLVLRDRGEAAASRHLTEFAAAILTLRAHQLCGATFSVRAVRFRHAAPQDVSAYETIFGVVPEFSSAVDAVVFDRLLLDLPIQAADPTASQAFEARAEDDDRHSPSSFEGRTRSVIASTLGQEPDFGSCARQLHLSPRTLQRRLRAGGTSFSKLVSQVQRDATLDLLRNTSTPLSEVAGRVGFRDVSAFYRAFRRWTGSTPREFRLQGLRTTVSHSGRQGLLLV